MFAEIDLFEDELKANSLSSKKRTRDNNDVAYLYMQNKRNSKDILDIDELHQFSKPPVIERKSLGGNKENKL